MKILALSGSLRAASVNSALLRVLRDLAVAPVEIRVYGAMAELPLYNPDLEACLPAVVRALRSEVAAADALLIASPEYAHGVSGVIKNALDWLVAFEGFAGKPVAVLNASPRAQHAYAALREILTTMSADLIEPASITLALPNVVIGEDGIRALPEIVSRLQGVLAEMAGAEQGDPERHESLSGK